MQNGLETTAETSTPFTVDVVPFDLDGHRFALPAADVLEVLRAASPTPLPNTPAIILGVLNVRGTLVPVLDLRARFHFPPRPLGPADHLLLVRPRDGRTSAIVVDRARAVEPMPMASIEHACAGAAHLAGLAAIEDGTIVIYDLACFLTTEEASSVDDALAESRGEPT